MTTTRTSLDDRRTVEEVAVRMRVNGEEELADELDEIAERIENPPVETVTQTMIGRHSPAAPDGWSWTDIGPFKGYWSGIRLQKGEPILEQDGHLLLVRQGETSFSERQVPIYENLSALLGLDDGPGAETHQAVTVMVVHGYQGDRRGFTIFAGGEQHATTLVPGPEVILGYILDWLGHAHADPIIARRLPPRPPKQERLA